MQKRGVDYVCLDRDLGAGRVAIAAVDANAYGDSYQWVRAADGHKSPISPLTSVLTPTYLPKHDNFITVGSSPLIREIRKMMLSGMGKPVLIIPVLPVSDYQRRMNGILSEPVGSAMMQPELSHLS